MLPVIHFLLDLPGIRTLSNIEAGLDFLQGLFQIQRESESITVFHNSYVKMVQGSSPVLSITCTYTQ